MRPSERACLWAVLLAIFVLVGCAQGTDTLPEDDRSREATAEPSFGTYDEAQEHVRATYDGERIDTSRSSWITGAEYFEAGGRGYLILGMNGKDYIFEGVPPEVWEGFKDAPSLGRYYNSQIRGRYGFDLRGSTPLPGENDK